MATSFANAAFVSAAWDCFFYPRLEHSLVVFSAKSLVPGQNGLCGETVFSLCLLILLFPLYPYICKIRKAIWAYGHLWRIWMSFRCHSDVVQMSFGSRGIFKRQVYLLSRCKHLEMKGGWTTFFLAIKRECFGNLCVGHGGSPHLNASSQTPLLKPS